MGLFIWHLASYGLAKKQYDEGLSIDSTNTHLLTDLATYYMGQFYSANQMPENDLIKDPKSHAKQFMTSAIEYLLKSYKLDPKDVNTVYKLSICYLNIEDCSNAWKFYDEAVQLGGKPITKEYTRDLEKRCKRK